MKKGATFIGILLVCNFLITSKQIIKRLKKIKKFQTSIMCKHGLKEAIFYEFKSNIVHIITKVFKMSNSITINIIIRINK